MGCMEEKGELHEVLVPWWLQHRTPVLKHSWSEQEVPRGTALGAGGGSKRGIVKVGNIKCESWSICFFIYIYLEEVESVSYWTTSEDHKNCPRSPLMVLFFALVWCLPGSVCFLFHYSFWQNHADLTDRKRVQGSVPGFGFHVWHRTPKCKRATLDLEIDSQECICIWNNSVCKYLLNLVLEI